MPALTSCGTSASIAGTLARMTIKSASFAGTGREVTPDALAGDLTRGRGIADAQQVIDRAAFVGQLAQRAREDHPAGRDDGDLGAQRLHVVHLVAGQQHGGAVGGESAQHLVHVLAARRVQAVGRLVEYQQPRPDQQGGGEPDPLPHAEGEAAHLVVRDIREPDLRQCVIDLRLLAVAAQSRQFGEVAPRGQRGVDAGAVDEARHAVGHEQRTPGGLAKHLEGALVGGGQAKQDAEQRGLARAVRPDQAVDLPCRDIEVNAIECYDVAEVLRDPPAAHSLGHFNRFFSKHA